jgi:hypothetical protein
MKGTKIAIMDKILSFSPLPSNTINQAELEILLKRSRLLLNKENFFYRISALFRALQLSSFSLNPH